MARLHGLCFVVPRPWSAEEIAALLDSPLCFVCARVEGFLIGRVVVGEAELLTLAVDPAAQRQGIGRALVAELIAVAAARGAVRVFLEVARDNVAALTLYRAMGFREAGVRRGYYQQTEGAPVDALVMDRVLVGGPA
jgi:[ribosomal protein S18]-alanine N-acetyltransferase